MRKLLFLLLLPLLLCSCIDYCLNPISDIREGEVDDRLFGTWVYVTEDERGRHFLHIGEGGKNWMIYIHPDPKFRTITVDRVYVSKIDDRTFLNEELNWDKAGKIHGYLIKEYKLRGSDTLVIYHVEWDFVRTAIENNRLLGIYHSEGRHPRYIEVLENSSEVRQFIKNSPKEELFNYSTEYKRLNF